MVGTRQFALAAKEEIANRKRGRLHIHGRNKNVVCVTDDRASPKNEWRKDPELIELVRVKTGSSIAEIVVDASEGVIPLWAEHTVLRWRFHEVSMQAFENPDAAKEGVRELFQSALAEWGTACPIGFVEDQSRYDFEIVMRSEERCSLNGCVLASAFFPDGGQHELVIYPTMFEQTPEEQLETLVHEIGHIFGLRHFFALISETAWPAIIYGEHKKFSIMNYGEPSELTDADKADLKLLYENVWSRKIIALNGTPVELMRPHTSQQS